jgi:hypothetical protein
MSFITLFTLLLLCSHLSLDYNPNIMSTKIYVTNSKGYQSWMWTSCREAAGEREVLAIAATPDSLLFRQVVEQSQKVRRYCPTRLAGGQPESHL